MKKLGVNIDHVATLRQARLGIEPDPVEAAKICENAGADSIVAHIREDRRHINDKDIKQLKQVLKGRFNIEMSLNPKIIKLALSVKPDQITVVPEKRQELTTEGGLNVAKYQAKIKKLVKDCAKNNIEVSIFVDPVKTHIKKCADVGVKMIEIHTGKYANAKTPAAQKKELKKIADMAKYAKGLGLTVNAGHGLNYTNTKDVAAIPEIEEFNIGHSLISQAVFVGLGNAVREMRMLIGVR